MEAGRASHSVRAETGLCDERRARSDAPYLGWYPQPAMTAQLPAKAWQNDRKRSPNAAFMRQRPASQESPTFRYFSPPLPHKCGVPIATGFLHGGGTDKMRPPYSLGR
jgi:hypothetical protein